MTYGSAQASPERHGHVLIRIDENRRSLQGTFGEATSTDLGEPWSDFLKRSGYPVDETNLVEGYSTYDDTIHAAMRKVREERRSGSNNG